MKQINIISDVYRNIDVNFNGFIVKFNSEGKGSLEFKEEQTEKIKNILATHSNIFEGDQLPIKEEIKVIKKQENSKESINEEVSYLKESNKKLALENSQLKKENEELKKQIAYLEEDNELKDTQEEIFEKQEMNQEENSEEQEIKDSEVQEENNSEAQEENNSEEVEEKKDIENIKKELNKKTIPQLKELLNEDLIEFKEEWKSLTKKEDIIDFIISKI